MRTFELEVASVLAVLLLQWIACQFTHEPVGDGAERGLMNPDAIRIGVAVADALFEIVNRGWRGIHPKQ